LVKTTPKPNATKNKSGELEPPGEFVDEGLGDEPVELVGRRAADDVELIMYDRSPDCRLTPTPKSKS
jgi:hypothetical protein